MTYALQKQITRKHFKKKENKTSPKFIQLHCIVIKTRIDITQKNSREMLQINEKSPASSPLMIHNTYPCYSSKTKRMSYYQLLLQSVCTKCRVQTAHGRCWTVVSRFDSADKYFCTHDENQTKISQELLV